MSLCAASLRRLFSRASLLAVFLGLIGLCLGGVANAYWAAAGSGQGSATSTTAAPAVVSAAAPTTALYPGGHADLALTISNPNPFSVHVGSLKLDTTDGAGGFTVDAGHAGCALSALSFDTQTNGGAGWSLPAAVGALTGSLPITLAGPLGMDIGAANACQGAAITVALVAGP